MVLRTTYPDGGINFTNIGDNFHLIRKEDEEEFKKTCDIHFGKDDTHFTPHCYGFLVHRSGSEIEPLYEKQESVVMVFRDDSYDSIWLSRR